MKTLKEKKKLAELEESEESSEISIEEENELDQWNEVNQDEVGDSVFQVGDFVWGKIKNHPWWPGQIYNVSDASDLALKHKPNGKDSYLVAYFGDGTFSWCSRSQLKRFDDNFQVLSCQTNSKSFMFAVEDALIVLYEIAAQEIGCACVRKERRVAENAGIRKEVLVPMVGFDKFPDAQFDSAAVIACVKNAARLLSVKNRLELIMLSSKLLAFNSSKGFNDLAKYCLPVYIDGLEDISKRGVDIASMEEEVLVSKKDKLYGRRKQDVSNAKDNKKTPAHSRKRGGQTGLLEEGSAKGRKRVTKTSVVTSGADKSADSKRKRDSVTPFVSVKDVGFEPVVLNLQTDTRVGEQMSNVAKQIIESPPIRKKCNIVFEKEPLQECSVWTKEQFLQNDQIMTHGSRNIDSIPEGIPSELKPATLTPLHERPFGSKLDVFSLNKLSNKDTLMNVDDDDNGNGRPLSAILFLTFSPKVPVPSKADLLVKYREFGSLNEEETYDVPNSHCAQVCFIKKSDGEQAFNHVVEMKSVDSGVQYCIRYIPRGTNFGKQVGSVDLETLPQSSKVNNDEPQPLSVAYLKEKLETLTSKLSKAEGEIISNDLKNELLREMKSLFTKLR